MYVIALVITAFQVFFFPNIWFDSYY